MVLSLYQFVISARVLEYGKTLSKLRIHLLVLFAEDQMHSLKVHLEGVVKSAQHHLRRDELWKRMVYGKHLRGDARPTTASPFEPLSCADFRELLRLVTVCPLEKLDPRLAPLRKQNRKWYRRLME